MSDNNHKLVHVAWIFSMGPRIKHTTHFIRYDLLRNHSSRGLPRNFLIRFVKILQVTMVSNGVQIRDGTGSVTRPDPVSEHFSP